MTKFIKYKELIMGAVRIYINEENRFPMKVSSFVMTNTINSYEQFGAGVVKEKETTFGNYFYAFDHTKSNKDIYNKINGLDKLVEDGSTVTIFGYGYSGSGKTYTLFGDESVDVDGISDSLLFNNNNVSQPVIQVIEIFELYLKSINFSSMSLEGQRIDVIEDIYVYKEHTANYEKLITWQKVNKDNIIRTKDSYRELQKIIEDHRINRKRIRATINNPKSSRSHLFIKIKKVKGSYVFCDMGGRENPMDIFNKTMIVTDGQHSGKFAVYNSGILQPCRDTDTKIDALDTWYVKKTVYATESSYTKFNIMDTGNEIEYKGIKNKIGNITPQTIPSIKTMSQLLNATLGTFVRTNIKKPIIFDEINKRFDYTVDIYTTIRLYDDTTIRLKDAVYSVLDSIMEGFYINESINHLVDYFNHLNSNDVISRSKPEFKKTQFMYTSENYFNSFDEAKVNNDPILIVTELKKLKSIDEVNENIFCMFACLRKDPAEKYLNFNIQTLKFAQSISSAGLIATQQDQTKKGGAIRKIIDKKTKAKKAAKRATKKPKTIKKK